MPRASSLCIPPPASSASSPSRAAWARRSSTPASGAGIGIDKFISVGNEAMVSAFDVLDYLRDDPAHRVRHALSGRHRRRPPLPRRGPADHRAQAGRRAPRRSHRGRRPGRRLAHGRAGRLRRGVPGGRPPGGRGDLRDALRTSSISAPASPICRFLRAAAWRSSPTAAARRAGRRRGRAQRSGAGRSDLRADRDTGRAAASVLEPAESARPGGRGFRRRRAAGPRAGGSLRDGGRRASAQLPRGAEHRGRTRTTLAERGVRGLHAVGGRTAWRTPPC